MIKMLNRDLIKINSTSQTKMEVLEEITCLLTEKYANFSKQMILDALIERESLSSTGLGSGIAIPHCTIDGIDEFYVGLIRLDINGIDFDAIDGQPVNLVFFSVGPKTKQNQHISTLTSISKVTTDSSLTRQIHNSKNTDEIYTLLHKEETNTADLGVKCQFVIHVQDEKLFHDLLEILTSDIEGSISILDAQTAGHYLHKLPLFSSFWNDVENEFSKIVIAVINKRLMNETIRRINMAKMDHDTGLIVTVHELLYFDGSLEY